MIKFKEQFDKLTRAYIAGKVNPLRSCACFVGNLLNESDDWGLARMKHNFDSPTPSCNIQKAYTCILKESRGTYTPSEIFRLERIFMKEISGHNFSSIEDDYSSEQEEVLFLAFEKTLKALKALHISKGEVIDENPIFTKRQLACSE